MKHEDVIRIARQAGITFVPQEKSPLSRFASLAVSAERKACLQAVLSAPVKHPSQDIREACANAIKARSEA